jgi:hypothetical protein
MNLAILFGFILFILGLIPTYFGLKYNKFRKVVLKTPTSKIWDLHKGLVEIYGEVNPSEKGTMISPILQKECVYYKYKIQEYRRHGKSGSYVTISEGKEHRLFYLQDVTGFVLVDSRNAKIDIFNKYKITTGFFKNIPVSAIPFLQKNNISFKSPLIGCKNMRFEEETIVPYNKLYVLGNVNNRFNIDEIPIKPGETEGLIQKNGGDHIYYISDATEQEILRKYKIRSIAVFALSALVFLAGIAIILSSVLLR